MDEDQNHLLQDGVPYDEWEVGRARQKKKSPRFVGKRVPLTPW